MRLVTVSCFWSTEPGMSNGGGKGDRVENELWEHQGSGKGREMIEAILLGEWA